MKCPYCSDSIHEHFTVSGISSYVNPNKVESGWQLSNATCPSCHQPILYLEFGRTIRTDRGQTVLTGERSKIMVWPQASNRPCALDVPSEIASDFSQAVRVLPISAQASAALTRRILQQVLRDYGRTRSKDLFDQIQEVVDGGHISHALAEQLDMVRVIGNFAAHPLKSTASGVILPVEPHEAEWNLSVLEDVFDHYFVKPARTKAMKAALSAKLVNGGKQPLT